MKNQLIQLSLLLQSLKLINSIKMKLCYTKTISFLLASLFSIGVFAQTPDFKMVGFATLNGGTTGGASGETVTPTTFEELKQFVEDPSTPYIIRIVGEFNRGVQTWVDADGSIVESTADGAIETTFGAILKVGSNKTVLGVGSDAFFNRVGLVIQCQSNIIIRNIRFTMKSVPATRDGEYKILDIDGVTTIGDPDCIGIQADAEGIPENDRISEHIWIDHCEFFNENIDNKDRYDGLLDSKNNVQNMTISWNYFHDHSKALLSGRGSSDNYNRTITFHHNYFYQIYGSRLPLLRFGQHHYFNNFMEACAGDGVNLRINSNGYIENNYFKDSKKPVFGKLSENGQGLLIDNIFDNCSRLPEGITNINGAKSDPLSSSEEFLRACNFTPSELYTYNDVLAAAADVPAIVKAYSGVGKISEVPDAVIEVAASNRNVWVNGTEVIIKAEPNTTAIIYDANGKQVYYTILENELNVVSLKITGLYIVRLSNNIGITSYKVVL